MKRHYNLPIWLKHLIHLHATDERITDTHTGEFDYVRSSIRGRKRVWFELLLTPATDQQVTYWWNSTSDVKQFEVV